MQHAPKLKQQQPHSGSRWTQKSLSLRDPKIITYKKKKKPPTLPPNYRPSCTGRPPSFPHPAPQHTEGRTHARPQGRGVVVALPLVATAAAAWKSRRRWQRWRWRWRCLLGGHRVVSGAQRFDEEPSPFQWRARVGRQTDGLGDEILVLLAPVARYVTKKTNHCAGLLIHNMVEFL